jgi:2-polyprenyl-3-methyl-5-hydroxy-6-metoxy-1,4-benzoquinol methylase
MNRKERRAARRIGAHPGLGVSANTTPAAEGEKLFRAAVEYHRTGALEQAERSYRQLLAVFPTHAETHSRLGAVIMAQGRASEAISHMARAVALNPELFEGYGNLAQAYMWTGQREQAIEAAGRALELRETPQAKAMFAQCVSFARFTADSERFRGLLLRALTEGWVRPRDLTRACISIIKLSPLLSGAIARVDAAWPRRLPAGEMFGADGIAAAARDPLLCRLLERDPVTDVSLERLLTSVRRAMLQITAAQADFNEEVLSFYCSIARQCFINEYVFSITEGEADEAQDLRAMLELALSNGDQCPALWPAIVGAYFPLHELSNAQVLRERSWPQCVSALLVQQLEEPAQERRLAATIPRLTEIDGAVSRAVRQQYEENPYPRWVNTAAAGQPAVPFRQQRQVLDALIAGCGTGLSTIECARQWPGTRITAIDLSLASLSYAKRMAEKLVLTNIEFAQADIMKLASIGRQFDFIDASGVLHHLADPREGWRILLSLLRPGGVMQIGLYSALARQNIVAARAIIAERGYRPIAQDIRRCREEIMAGEDPLLRSVVDGGDFFTIGECRDLLFHVQEQRTTLPEIKSLLAANDVQFVGFYLDAFTRHTFAKRFPAPSAITDLDCWHQFETEAPGTFAGMYQFLVRKPDADLTMSPGAN